MLSIHACRQNRNNSHKCIQRETRDENENIIISSVKKSIMMSLIDFVQNQS